MRRGIPLGFAVALSLVLAPGLGATEPKSNSDSVPVGLPPVPSLRLTLPTLVPPQPSSAAQSLLPLILPHEAAVGFLTRGHRTLPIALLGPRYVLDSELALRIEGFSWTWRNWRLHSGAELAPSSGSDCGPECRIGTWSSRVQLGYDLGTIGPVRNATPFLEVRRKDANPSKRLGTGVVRFGLDGAF